MTVKIFVFDRDQRVAEHGREVVVGGHNPALQRERSDDAAVIVVEFGDRAGAVCLESVNLREISGVDEQQSGGGSDQRGNQHEESEQNAADESASADFHLGQIFVENLHVRMRSG